MSKKPENPIVVYEDIQEDYIIDDREIKPNDNPKFNNNILVTDDNLSNRLYFNMFWTFDDRSVTDKNLYVLWVNANNEKGISECTDKQVDDVGERLSFAWNVPQEATYKAGNIRFAVRLTANNYVWNSLPTTVEVKQGLQINDYPEAVVPSANKLSIISINKSEYDALEVKNNSIVYVVNNNGNFSMYLGVNPIS